MFCCLLAHEFCVRWMKNRCLVCSDLVLVCFVDADVRGPLWRYCFKLEVAPVGFSHFPHRPGERGKAFVPGEAIVSNTLICSLSHQCWSSCSLRSSSVAVTPPSSRRSHDSSSSSLSRRGSGVEALSCMALQRSFSALPA